MILNTPEPQQSNIEHLDLITPKNKYSFKSFNWKLFSLFITAAIVAGAIPFFFFVNSRTSEPAITTTDNTPKIVTALGRLQPKDGVLSLSASSSFEQAKVQQLLIKEGDWIEAGQVIAILESHNRLKAELEEAEQELAVARARLAQVKAGASIGEIEAQQAKIERLEVNLHQSSIAQEANVNRIEVQLLREEAAQEAKLVRLEAEVQNAQTECKRSEALFQAGAVSASTRGQACLLATTFHQQFKEAQATQQQSLETLQEKIIEAHANRVQTQEDLIKQVEEAKATLRRIVEVRPEDLHIVQAEVKHTLATVEKAKAELKLASVRALKAGRILKIHTYPGEVVGAKGIAELGQTEEMYAIAEVYETDIGRVQSGQKATISSEFGGFNGDLRGIVDEITWKIGKQDVLDSDPTTDVDVRVREVKVRIEPQDTPKIAGLTNLQVRVNIHL